MVVNAGSSSLKVSVLDGADAEVMSSARETRDGDDIERALEDVLEGVAEVGAVGHRVVHGGTRYTSSVVVDDAVVADLAELVELAPLHQPAALAGLKVSRRVLADVPHVACFDTAFHATLPERATTYAVPAGWREDFGVRRFGFHGLSHAYAARRAASLLRKAESDVALVTCHLGAGASLAAVLGGASIDTTMGFTPLEGLVMATRSGSVDPGLLMWLLSQKGLSVADVSDALEHRSGLLGLAGSADMREVLTRRDAGDKRAAVAIDVYVHRLSSLIGAMVVSLGRIDALVFTGGVGERASAIRAAVAERLRFLGVRVDASKNEHAHGDVDVSATDAPVRTVVVEAREDLEIARQTRQLLRS